MSNIKYYTIVYKDTLILYTTLLYPSKEIAEKVIQGKDTLAIMEMVVKTNLYE